MIENCKTLLWLFNGIVADNDIMPRVHLLYITVDSSQIVLLSSEITLRLAHDEADKDKTDYSSQNGHQSQNPVHKEHSQNHSHQKQARRDNTS